MNNKNPKPSHFAILIGINAYQQKPLRGAVRDVQCLQAYLENMLPSISVTTLTATNDIYTGSNVLVEHPQRWPTRQNINLAFQKVVDTAKAGDFVLFHFSGHGTRETPNARSYNKSSGDLALVVLTGNRKDPETYLFGRSLAYSVNAMVAKGLVVTVVLDCCYSASVPRVERPSNPNIRFLPFDAAIASRVPLDSEYTGLEPYESGERDASMLPNWLIDPNKYTILVACGPHELAGEIQCEGGIIQGALSYLLLKTLKGCNGLTSGHKQLYNRLQLEFRTRGLRQNPVLYGNKEQGFLGYPTFDTTTSMVPASKQADGTFLIPIGQAHGVSQDDQFALEPLSRTKNSSQNVLVIGRVAYLNMLTSTLRPVIMPPSMSYHDRWQASPISQLALQRFPIQLRSNLPHQGEWLMEFTRQSLRVHSDTEMSAFNIEVTLNESKGYEVRDGNGRLINNLPVMPQAQTSAQQIGDVLKHLARYQLARRLGCDASTSAFRGSFNVHIISNGISFDPESPICLEDGTMATIVIENQGIHDLYVSIYNLGPNWQIQNVYHATYTVVAAQGRDQQGEVLRRRLKMSIPRKMKEDGHRSCTDILKIFVTSQPASFDFLELPKLGEKPVPGQHTRLDTIGDKIVGDFVAVNFSFRVQLPSNAESSRSFLRY